jgi:hypothetical protein
LDDTVRPRPVSFKGFGALGASALAEIVFAGLDFAGAAEVLLGFFAVEVFLVPMTVHYTTPRGRSTNSDREDLLHRRPGSSIQRVSG